jgi:hypothetical protein
MEVLSWQIHVIMLKAKKKEKKEEYLEMFGHERQVAESAIHHGTFAFLIDRAACYVDNR